MSEDHAQQNIEDRLRYSIYKIVYPNNTYEYLAE